MQVSEDNGAVVRARQQVVGVDGEAHSSYLVGVRLECLDDATAADVPQHARGILVTGRQQSAGRLNAHGRKCTACTCHR